MIERWKRERQLATTRGRTPRRGRPPTALRLTWRTSLLPFETVQVGGAIGLAALATLATERTGGRIAEGDSTASALNAGYHLAYLVGAGLVGVAVVVALVMLRPAARRQEHAPALGGAERAYSEAG